MSPRLLYSRVARSSASDRNQDVFVPVVAKIRQGHALTFVELGGARRGSDIQESISFIVAKKHFGGESAILRAAGCEKNIQEAVVIDISEIGPHRHVDFIEANFGSHILKRGKTRQLCY